MRQEYSEDIRLIKKYYLKKARMNIMTDKGNTRINMIKIIISACFLYAVSAGLRSVYGIMINAISAEGVIRYAMISFAVATGQMVFGISQPLFGVLALKKSKRFVLITGAFCMAVGLGMIPYCKTSWMLLLFLGIILPIGTGAVSFGMIMGAVTPKVGEKKAVTISGLVNASSGVGGIVLSPLIQKTVELTGLKVTMLCLALIAVALIPCAIAISDKQDTAEDTVEQKDTVSLLMNTLKNKNYWFLLIGFFTCGFHMAIIETHLFSQVISYGISESNAALMFSVYGFATVIGSLISGVLCGKIPMKYVVGGLYGSRVIWVLGFMLLPKESYIIFAYIVLLGLTGAATLTPTSGLTGKIFGSENLAMLFGIVFLSHQCGSFFSSWLGGKCLEMTGNYNGIWVVAAALSFIAMAASLCIQENNVEGK